VFFMTVCCRLGASWLFSGLLLCSIPLAAPGDEPGKVRIEFHIQQDTDLILFSDFGEPAQCAIWLEDPETHATQDVFVTRRAGRGEWDGKAECPAALPRWFHVFALASGTKGPPTREHPVPDGISQATPKGDRFSCSVEVAAGRRQIIWVEVNLSGDYNATFPAADETSGGIDTDCSGQPSLVYRTEFEAVPGFRVVPELYAYTVPRTRKGELCRDLAPITTAKEVYPSIEIRVERPEN